MNRAREDPRHQARLIEQGAQQQVVHGRHEALSEEEDPVIQDDQRLAGDQRARSGSGLPQGHDRQEADDASEDGGGFQDARADEAQRDPFVLPLDHRVQRDGGADAGEGHDDLQDAADEHGSVRARADDVVRTVHRIVEKEGRDRDKGEQVEHARDQRGLSCGLMGTRVVVMTAGGGCHIGFLPRSWYSAEFLSTLDGGPIGRLNRVVSLSSQAHLRSSFCTSFP